MEIQKVIECTNCGSGNTDVILGNNANGSVVVQCCQCKHIWKIVEQEPITYTEQEVLELLEAFKVTLEFAKQYRIPCDIKVLFEGHKKK